MRAFAIVMILVAMALAAAPRTSSRSREVTNRKKPILEQQFRDAGLRLGSKVFFRAFKASSDKLPSFVREHVRNENGARTRARHAQWHHGATIEVWVEPSPGAAYIRFAAYPVCKYSGTLGPKKRQGDKQTPEGFYGFGPRTRGGRSFQPNSQYHLALNIEYPNTYDRAHGYTGGLIMIHGRCGSIGCYAMTDAYMEDLWVIAEAAAIGGQDFIPVHSFPFPMSADNVRLASTYWSDQGSFWEMIKLGYDMFERTHVPPTHSVVRGRYNFQQQGRSLSPRDRRLSREGIAPLRFENEWDWFGMRDSPPTRTERVPIRPIAQMPVEPIPPRQSPIRPLRGLR